MIMNKPAVDEVTGCAHIRNYKTTIGRFRGCSVCMAGVPDHVSGGYIDESIVEYCWNCGATFDHTDDDEEE
ncbi:MAG: hypothetical protein IJH25_08400 [Clostridia bacterium]|nr:hypothetical protein [Clostridia bacterium]MBQ6121558.1 hypothetical protein [Clostridia bacterium]